MSEESRVIEKTEDELEGVGFNPDIYGRDDPR